MPRAVADPLSQVEVTCVTTARRALRMALSLRLVEALLAGLPQDEDTAKRREEMLYLARWIERHTEAVQMEMATHQRARTGRVKTVWCEGGCQTALTLAQLRESPFCRNCRRRAEADE